MDKVGAIIKLNRVIKGITQTNLAQDICSFSYLSKIENGTAKGNKEVIYKLLNRLDITYDPIKDGYKVHEVRLLLTSIYKDITLKKSKDFSRNQLELLLNNQQDFYPDFFTWLLVVSRLYISLDDIKNSEFYMSFIADKDNEYILPLTDVQKYYFLKFKGLIEYKKNNSVEALQFIQKAMLDDYAKSLGDWEEADMNYIISLGYLKDENIIECIRYIKKAFDFFNKANASKRLIESLIVLGIAYKQSHMYEEAEMTYNRAFMKSCELGIDDFKGMILHNLGNLSKKPSKNPQEAISYYIKSLEYSSDLHRLITYFDLTKIFYREKNYTESIHWANVGLEEISTSEEDIGTLSYYYHLNIYKTLSTEGHISEDIGNAAVDHFEKIKAYQHCIHYSKLIGEHYMVIGKYKLAAIHLKRSTEFVLLDKKLETWEELDQ